MQEVFQSYLDNVSESGVLTLGSRFKRLGEILQKQVQNLFFDNGIEFKPAWFPILIALKHKDNIDIKTLSARLKITHSATSQLIKELYKHDYIRYREEKSDLRMKNISLTPKARDLLERLVPYLQRVEETLTAILGEHHDTLFKALNNLEYELQSKPFLNRRLPKLSNVMIVDYEDSFKDDLTELNREWISGIADIEKVDQEFFDNPKSTILENGGRIFIALYEGKVIGTVSVVPKGSKKAELTKMAVKSSFQGRGVGEQLLDTAIQHAKELSSDILYLETVSVLKVANSLYRKKGFQELPLGVNKEFERADTYMEKLL